MAGNEGGGTLSEVYQSARRILLRARDGIERLERFESSVSGADSLELSFSVKKDISQIHSLCTDMDRLWRSIPAKSQRDLWKRIKRISLSFRSRVLSTIVTLFVALLGLLPRRVLRLISELSNGKSWSNTAHEAACSHLPQYHTIRNVLYMARTEFIKLSETPDWNFMRENQEKISFLYGIDDHWGPLQMFEEVSRQAPGIGLSIEREGHTHGFCCSEAGSIWVARHAAGLIKNKLAS